VILRSGVLGIGAVDVEGNPRQVDGCGYQGFGPPAESLLLIRRRRQQLAVVDALHRFDFDIGFLVPGNVDVGED
jgi:hypothetical protein